MLPLESLAQQRKAFAPASARSDSESIAINTQLVSLQVCVTDKEGRFIAGLEPPTSIMPMRLSGRVRIMHAGEHYIGKDAGTTRLKTFIAP